MNWFEVASEWLRNFFNQPVPIIGCTVASLLVSILIIISKTSIGKKSLSKMKEMYNTLGAEFNSYKFEKEKLLDELKKEYENKLALVENKKEETEKLLLEIAKHIHNKQVQDLVNEYEAKPEIVNISDVVKTEVERAVSGYEELLKRIEALEHGKETENN